MKKMFIHLFFIQTFLFSVSMNAQTVAEALDSDLYLYYDWIAKESKDSTYNNAYRKFLSSQKGEPTNLSKKNHETTAPEKLSKAFTRAFWMDKNYDEAFYSGFLLEELLAEVSEQEFPEKRKTYYRLGEAYYLFLNFKKSISLLKKALSPTPVAFDDVTNLNALKLLGICYANLGEMELSDNYFRSVLKSPDIVLNRPLHNAYTLSHLGCNEMLRGNFNRALHLSAVAWPVLRQTADYGHLAGMCYCRGRSLLQQGDYKQASQWVDSLVHFARQDTYNPEKRIKQAYLLQTDYYSALGDIRRMRLYADSLVLAYRASEGKYTSGYITHATDRFNRAKIKEREEKLRENRTYVIASSLLASCGLLATLVIASLYRKRNAAYKALVLRARQWAENDSEQQYMVGISEEPTVEDVEIMSLANKAMTNSHLYHDPNLRLVTLAEKIGIHRNQLSRAVNRTTGGNFNQYINGFRIKEAVRLISGTSHDKLYIDELYEQVGFNSRTSFYRVFKQYTGLSPREFQSNG